MPRSILRGWRYPNSLRWADVCALCWCRLCDLKKKSYICLIKHFSRGKMCVSEYILWQLLCYRSDCAHLGEGTLSSYLKITVLNMTNTAVTELTYWHLWQLFCSQIVDLDNLIFERWQISIQYLLLSYLLSFITASKTKHGHGCSSLTASQSVADTNVLSSSKCLLF